MTTSILVTDYGRNYGRSQSFPPTLTADFLTVGGVSAGTTPAKLTGGPNLTYRVFVPDGAAAIEFASIELKDSSSNALFLWTSTEPILIAERQSLTVDIVVPAYSVISEATTEVTQLKTSKNVYSAVDALPSVSEDADPATTTAVVVLSETAATTALRQNGLWSLPTHSEVTFATLVFGGESQKCRLDLDPQDSGLLGVVDVSLLQFVGDGNRGCVRSVSVGTAVSPTSYEVSFAYSLPSSVSSGSRVILYTSGNAVNRTRVEDTALKAALARLDNFVDSAASRDSVDTVRREFEDFRRATDAKQASMESSIKTMKAALDALTSSVSVAPASKRGRF